MDSPREGGGRFDGAELGELRRLLSGGEAPRCPRCLRPLERTDLPPRADVPYVRRRILLVCGACGARGVVDRRDVDRKGR